MGREAMRSFLIGIGGILIGFALHQTWGTSPAPAPIVMKSVLASPGSPAAEMAARGIPLSTDTCTTDWERMRAEIRAAVREELKPEAAAAAAGVGTATTVPASGSAGAAAPVVLPPSDEQRRAFEAHAQLLDAAVKAGAWTDRDVERQRFLMNRIAPAQRGDALTALSRAINDGRLDVEARHPF